MQAWIPIVFWKSVFSFRVHTILKWRVNIKLRVSWLRAFLWCMSQTSRYRVNSRRVRTHEKNSGVAVRRLGAIIQSIFGAQSGASICLTVWQCSGESRYPRAFPPVLENFRRAFSPGPTDRPWISEDALVEVCQVFLSAGSRRLWPNSGIAIGTTYVNYYFSKVYKWNVTNWYLDIDFNLEVCGVIVLLEVWTRADFFKAVPSILFP